MEKTLELCKNDLVSFLKKSPKDFTLSDIIRYVREQGIEMVNFMYPAADGRLKTLNFVINDLAYLESILTKGERVDGSSLFPYISAGSSDLYVVPRLRTAFRDPFALQPTLTMLCSYFDHTGHPLESSPEYTLRKACSAFTKKTGLKFEAMGELEFYVIADDPGTFPASDQKGYHESAPFAKFNDFRTLFMTYIARMGGKIKYGHSEVGNFTIDGKIYEQNEIEFLPVDACDAADQLVLAKWAIRRLAAQEGLDVTFAPKITTGKAGSGLHIHIRLTDTEGRSVMLEKGRLSDAARTAIAGIMELAPAITAFGNTNPTSYFRLVPHQEAPTNICWGDRNRSVLVRVPLGWVVGATDMCAEANGRAACDIETGESPYSAKQTFEIRSADGSADVYLLLASLVVAARYGFEMDSPLDTAEKYYVDVDIHRAENAARLAALPTLPTSCHASAACLDETAEVFKTHGVFSEAMLKGQAAMLRSYDETRTQDALSDPDLMLDLVKEYFYCG